MVRNKRIIFLFKIIPFEGECHIHILFNCVIILLFIFLINEIMSIMTTITLKAFQNILKVSLHYITHYIIS